MRADVALLGTGAAPLIAANRLVGDGRSVLVLNPDWDFFSEDSELPFDPLLPPFPGGRIPIERLLRNVSERAIEDLRPEFPGAIEAWPEAPGDRGGYRDPAAPHVRARGRLWIRALEHQSRTRRSRDWEAIEDMYLAAADADLNPQVLGGLVAMRRFPGLLPGAAEAAEARGILLPRLHDVDLTRFRNGLLEFVRDRLGPERIVSGASQIEVFEEGVRYYAGGAPATARVGTVVVFWTPRLTQWIVAQARKAEVRLHLPEGVRLWEEWSLVSPTALDPGIIGSYEDMAVWAETEGAPAPGSRLERLAVLRAGPLVPVDSLERSWASEESFSALSRLCHEFLGWERVAVRSMRTRAILEWKDESSWKIGDGAPTVRIVRGCDGPLIGVVESARRGCEGIE